MKPTAPPPAAPSYCPPHHGDSMPHIMRQYLERYVYIWAQDRRGMWIYPTRIDDREIEGYAYLNGRWIPCRFDWHEIHSIY